MSKTLLVDLDDTLLPNAFLYYIPQLDAIKLMAVDLLWDMPNTTAIIKRATELQLEEIQQIKRISKECFSNSYVNVYKEICQSIGKAANINIVSAIIAATQKFFVKDYTLFPHVKETLNQIKSKKILLTRGDFDIQNYKITNTRLTPYFDHIEIVDLKNTQTYIDTLNKYNLQPEECAMVGDSLLNDIIPSLEVGMTAYHIISTRDDWESHHTNLLNDSVRTNSNYIQLKNFQEILNYLG